MKKLTRSRDNRIVSGVMGGIGEYFEVDPTVVRLAYLLATLVTGVAPGLVGYVLALLIVPKAPPYAQASRVHDAEPV